MDLTKVPVRPAAARMPVAFAPGTVATVATVAPIAVIRTSIKTKNKKIQWL
jgi:hypothetical protein